MTGRDPTPSVSAGQASLGPASIGQRTPRKQAPIPVRLVNLQIADRRKCGNDVRYDQRPGCAPSCSVHQIIGNPLCCTRQAARRATETLAAAACRCCRSLYHFDSVNRTRTAPRRISIEDQFDDHINRFARERCALVHSTNTQDRDASNVSTIIPSPCQSQRVLNPRKECTS